MTPLNRLLITALSAMLLAGVTPTTLGNDWGAFRILGHSIPPGTAKRFPFIPDASFTASYVNMPVFTARGIGSGPTLCLAAGVHGDELNGVEVARRAFSAVDPQSLRGTLIALPTINAEGVRSGDRYLSDRRDLNRAFPGRAGGSIASLIANGIFTEILVHCDALIDLHTASNQRANLPQVRADLEDPAIAELAEHFGIGIVVGGAGPNGSLRREAAKAGIPAIIYEAGEPYRFQQEEIERGVAGVMNVLAYLDMTEHADQVTPDSRIYERSRWLRADLVHGGFFFPSRQLGDVVAGFPGEIIGMAVPQPVLPGYALFHLAWHE